MPPLAIPPLVILTTMGAVAVGRWATREYRRINAELDSLRAAQRAEPIERSRLPTLRLDPVTGEYRLP